MNPSRTVSCGDLMFCGREQLCRFLNRLLNGSGWFATRIERTVDCVWFIAVATSSR